MNTAEVIDLNQPSPTWREVGAMAVARRQINATLLPDGNVLVVPLPRPLISGPAVSLNGESTEPGITSLGAEVDSPAGCLHRRFGRVPLGKVEYS